MKKSILILSLTFAFCCIHLSSCKKEKNIEKIDCSPDTDVFDRLVDEPEVIARESDGTFLIYQHGTIDTRLKPCNLPAEFQVHGLEITVSGTVKNYVNDGTPCCLHNFVITKIVKR